MLERIVVDRLVRAAMDAGVGLGVALKAGGGQAQRAGDRRLGDAAEGLPKRSDLADEQVIEAKHRAAIDGERSGRKVR
ncbi:hypothetical protein SDC9_211087 [bioreactor metagenome]|uniref:Uncharacterized protein n=1 Tax=bioreactor metagenome TaxID=1076179 RepID=A0A645JKT2_9ZZZZ